MVAAASLVAVGGLATWASAGYAGTPADVQVKQARVLLPVTPGGSTNAYFHLVNSGGAPDRLRAVTSSGAAEPELTEHRMNDANGAYREPVKTVTVPADGEVRMSPHSTAVNLRADRAWRPGDRVTFTLDLERSGRMTVQAVVRPVTLGSGF
ncbi:MULTISPECIES: copper chaperone PCu(A)C [Streptomyces]|uniref:copper chaperone PCu(A)C n=1 Tax=Streptomyces TaxID=1883 RepID=UPI001361AE4C|nr:copper chaperone PCu(A)C [Streptomyces albidoflavus]MYX52746.1 copper chaperone PCu(A)C [Streptomyces sp. SID8385]WSD43788.1 copper chaperone PCu(A)C [Streptomyces albidoflavus]CAI4175378.1 Copper chaperone PCu(A)C [Streptomyces albidoflavus]